MPYKLKTSIPLVNLNRQHNAIKTQIISVIQKVISQSNFVLGESVEKLEKRFSQFVGTKYAVGVDSGCSALELGMRGLGIKTGDEVITPVNSFIASSSTISAIGAKPVWIDCDPQTYNLDATQIDKLITKKTKAIMPVHLYGQPADMESIKRLAKKNNLWIIEDACQAHGAKYKDKPVGSFGDFAAFSFYPGKNLGAFGDAGILTTNNKKLAETVSQMRNYGQTKKYHHHKTPHNKRIDNLQAAILLVKLRYLKKWNRLRYKHAQAYSSILANIKSIKIPQQSKNSTHVYHLYVIETQLRDKLQKYLRNKGIQTGIHYPIPIHLQKFYQSTGKNKDSFPIAESVAKSILSLPMFPELKQSEIVYICTSIKKFYS